MTVEHAHGHRWGDSYAFLDFTWPDEGKPDYYFEVSPRLSLSKVFDVDLSNDLVRDVLISTTLEKPKHLGPRYLYGGAVDFNVPGFDFFKANAYVRDDTQLHGTTWQVTLAWKVPFAVGRSKFVAEGFADIAGHEEGSHPNQLIVPQFLLDAGHYWQMDNKLFIGVEYSYWHNKFGVKGKTENVPQAMIKWVF